VRHDEIRMRGPLERMSVTIRAMPTAVALALAGFSRLE